MTDGSENLINHAPCGILSCTEDGVIIMVNNYCNTLLEYDEQELIGANISTVLTLPARIFYQTHLYPLVKLHKHAEEIFLNFVTRSKKNLPIVLNAVVTTSGPNNVIVYSFIPVLNRRKFDDELIQAKRNAEDALRKNEVLEKIKQELEVQQRELDKQISLLTFQNNELLQLGNVVTHDLQEPVRKLVLFSHELNEGKFVGEKKEMALSAIYRSSEKIRKLLLNLQDYLSLSKGAVKKSTVNLQEVVDSALHNLQELHPEINVQIEMSELPTIVGDKEQLQLLFHHVLNNAFVHSTINNNLFLNVTSVIIKDNLFNNVQNKYEYIHFAKITVTDKGLGFENKYNQYIFDFLKRLDISKNTAGFGLAFCRKIVQNHYGNINAEGEVGVGATFTIMLPVDSLN